MDTIKNIKVLAHYETDSTPSKFDALFAQYEAAKAIADETESIKQPLIDAMGERKLELIYKQLDVIVQRLNMISKCRQGVVSIDAFDWSTANKLTVKIVSYCCWDKAEIYLCGYQTPRESWFKEYGIVTLWNKLGLYEKLEKKCEQMLEEMITQQNIKTEHINKNYNNMIND